MGVKYPMCVRCQIQIEVEQIGAVFRTREECPAGHRAGMEPMDLMELCVSCPKAEPQVLAGITEERFLSKKKKPVPKKTALHDRIFGVFPKQEKYPVPKKK